ncbi:MAG: hypothetical protein PHF63_00445 [Herbinix sp.]|nr:hypothetical protein [Herbinix sp.]
MRKETVEFTKTIGSFNISKNKGFDENLRSVTENFKNQYNLDIVGDAATILKSDEYSEIYREALLEDLDDGLQVTEAMSDTNPYSCIREKMTQLFENSRYELVRESAVGQMEPVVGLSLAVLKKNFLSCNSKDVVNTEIPVKPVIKLPFERDFLKDAQGKKYYIPEIYYNEEYKEVVKLGKGDAMPDTFYPESGTLPLHKFDVLGIAGGSLATRDTLNMDFCISAIKGSIPSGTAFGTLTTSGAITFTVSNLSIMPKQGTNGAFNNEVTTTVTLTTTNSDATEDTPVSISIGIFGEVDYYTGTISVTSAPSYVTQVKFGGHLSNVNNNNSLELDTEREIIEFVIPDNTRINTGLTVEKIKDFNVLFDTDITAKYVHLIGNVLTQTEDSDVFAFLDTSLSKWKTMTHFPFGYTEGFTESKEFSATIPTGKMYSTPEWIEKDLKFALDRFIQRMKKKLRTPDIMFVVYGHPNNVTLLNSNVRWVIDNDTRVGGIQLDYQFGVLTNTLDRVHVVSSMKVPEKYGLRIVAYPTSSETYTFKHYKYSFNIENTYRNPNAQNIPNVMGTSRYLTTEILPVQGELVLTNTGFGMSDFSGTY